MPKSPVYATSCLAVALAFSFDDEACQAPGLDAGVLSGGDVGAMVVVPAGQFVMGSQEVELGRRDNERPHKVTISHAFLLSATEVTVGEYRRVMDGSLPHLSPSCEACDDCPVANVTWYQAIDYCNRLSLAQGLTPCYSGSFSVSWDQNCTGYRLPTEAEWEYAARAGTSTAYHSGDNTNGEGGTCSPPLTTRPECSLSGSSPAPEPAWSDPNLERAAAYCTAGPQAVGQKEANVWGLYDMHGNVAEWVWDYYGRYPEGPVTDPVGPARGLFRVDRGGSWLVKPANCRAAYRDDDHLPFIPQIFLGFRVARSLPPDRP